MAKSCLWRPDSKLFDDLEAYFKKGGYNASDARNMAAKVYNLTQSPSYMRRYGLEKNGDEYSAKQIIDAFKLNEVSRNQQFADAESSGLLDKHGKPVVFTSANEALDKSKQFNETHDKSVATVEKTNNGFVVNVGQRSYENVNKADRQQVDVELNDRMLNIMRRLGFDVEAVDCDDFRSQFNPLNAKSNADGLMTVVQIANNERGWSEFPEEFSHFVIEGLHNNPLVARLVDFMTNERIAEVLGDSYTSYYNDYNGDITRLAKEAAGKVLQSYLVGQPIVFQQVQPTSLLERIKMFLKNLFGRLTGNTVQNEIDAANSAFKTIAENVFDDSLLDQFDKDAVIKAETLYATEVSFSNKKELAEAAVEQYFRQLRLMHGRGKKAQFTRDDLAKIKDLQTKIQVGNYKASVIQFMQYVLDDIRSINENISILSSENGTMSLQMQANMLRKMSDLNAFYEGKESIISRFKNIHISNAAKSLGFTQAECDEISEMANTVGNFISKTNEMFDAVKFSFVKNFLKQYWGSDEFYRENPPENVESINRIMNSDAGNRMSLDYLLNYCDGQIGFFERWILGMSQSSDMMLALVDHVVREAHNNRDARLAGHKQRIAALQKQAEQDGVDTSFIYERDEDGNVTGNYKIGLDIWRYYKERKEYRELLKADETLSNEQRWSKLMAWDNAHTEVVTIISKVDDYGNTIERKEARPKHSLYGNNDIENMTAAQRAYYDKFMEMKIDMDAMLPESRTKSYNAVQIHKNVFLSIRSPKSMWQRVKDTFTRREDDVDFGSSGDTRSEGRFNHVRGGDPEFGNTVCVTTDGNGDIINQLPVHFVHRLDDMNDLSLDASAGLMAYATTCVDFDEMNKIVDALELTKDVLNNRQTNTYSNTGKREQERVGFGKAAKDRFIKWSKTDGSSMLEQYYESNIYGRRHKAEAKILNTLKEYNTLLGMGMNIFANAANVLGGFNQALMHAGGALIHDGGAAFFNLKDMAQARGIFWKHFVTGVIPQAASALKDNELQLLIDTFDPMSDFFENMRRENYYNSATERILGSSFDTFAFGGNNAGEYFMHTTNMIAILLHEKVLLNGEETSVYEALETFEDAYGVKRKRIKNGVTKLDGTAFTKDDLMAIKNKIGECNRNLLGGYNQLDKGAINKWVSGRFLMQFRQWMPEHYNRRWGKARFNFEAQKWVEGYQRTLLRYINDVRKASFNFVGEWNNLTDAQKHNIGQALVEEAILLALSALCKRGILGWLLSDDDDDKPWENMDGFAAWSLKFMNYQMRRMYMETAASGLTISMVEEGEKIIKSPIPVVNTIEKILAFAHIETYSYEYQRGQYAGHTKAYKYMIELIPGAKQIHRLDNLLDDDSIFAIFDATFI